MSDLLVYTLRSSDSIYHAYLDRRLTIIISIIEENPGNVLMHSCLAAVKDLLSLAAADHLLAH